MTGEPLLTKVAAGDPRAVLACIDRFGGLVWTLARKSTPGNSDAEDAAQEVFVELWRHAARFDPTSTTEPAFVAGVARRRLAERQRRQSARPGAAPAIALDDAAIAAAVAGEQEPLPNSLRPSLVALAGELASEVGDAPGADGYGGAIVSRGESPAAGWIAWTGWVVAAVCIVLAATVWIPRFFPGGSGEAQTLADRRLEFVKNATDAVAENWIDFVDLDTGAAPEIAGVGGDVIWSEARQEGYLRFTGLKPGKVGSDQYQLWIIDERGPGQRIPGVVFDAGSGGELIVPIKPASPIRKAAAFAVTIERPGGAVSTDFSRRVCLAVVRPVALRIKDRRDELARASYVQKAAWTDYKSPDARAQAPEVRGVWGEVVWSEARQEGYMTFHDLPTSISGVEQYQVWIVDQRGPTQRISGGIFDVRESGEVIVQLRPALKVRNAESFAVTIEKIGGVVVSDLSRRVCIAKIGG